MPVVHSAAAANRNRLLAVFGLTLAIFAVEVLCECLAGFFDIEHSTFQIETADRRSLEDVAHA
jgi:hypothetical protein